MKVHDPSKPTIRIRPALVLGLEGTVRRSKSGATFPTSIEDIELLPNITNQILAYKKLGYLVLLIAQDNRPSLGLKSIEESAKEMDKTIGLFNPMPFNDIKIQYSNTNATVANFKVSTMNELPKVGALALFEKDALDMGFIVDWSKSLFVGCTKIEQETARNAGIPFVESGTFLTSIVASGPDTKDPSLN